MSSRSRRQRRVERSRQQSETPQPGMVPLPLVCPSCGKRFNSDLYANANVILSGSISQTGATKPCPQCAFPVDESGTWTFVRRSAELMSELDRDDLVIVRSTFGAQMTPEEYREAIESLNSSTSPKVRRLAGWLSKEAAAGIVGALAVSTVLYLAGELSDPANAAVHSIEELVRRAIEHVAQ